MFYFVQGSKYSFLRRHRRQQRHLAQLRLLLHPLELESPRGGNVQKIIGLKNDLREIHQDHLMGYRLLKCLRVNPNLKFVNKGARQEVGLG
jgi:hypothetical protein